MSIREQRLKNSINFVHYTEIFDYSTGISVNNTTGIFSSKTIVSMRGLPSNEQSRTLVLLDGIPLNKADAGSVNWNMINKSSIENIKVIKGPGHARYGSGAMGGVIEMTSKKPKRKLEGDALISYGTYNTLTSNINLSGISKNDSLNNFYWNANAFARKSDGYITTPEVYRTIEDTILVPTYLNEINTSAKIGYHFKNNQNLEGQFGFFDDKRGNGVKVFDNYGAFSKHKTLKALAKYNGSAGFIKWQTIVYNTSEFYKRIYEYMNEGEYKLYEADSKRNDRGVSSEFTYFRFEKHKIETGFNLKLGSVDGTDTYYTSTDIIRNSGKMNTYALYLQDDFLINKKLQLNFGLRYDFAQFYDALFSISYPSYSIIFYQNFETENLKPKQWDALCPRFSMQYNINNENRIYISAARGFRAPVLDDLSRTGKRRGSFNVANPDLNPELISTFETGGDITLTPFFLLSTSAYYSLGKDFMYYTSTGDSVNMGYKLAPIFKKQNIGKVQIFGVETELKYDNESRFTTFVNYAYTYALIAEHNILNAQVDSNLTGKFLTDIPSHKASAGVSYRHKIVNSSLLFKYYGATWINEWNIEDKEYFKTDKFPSYYTVNLRFEREFFKNLSVAVNIENLFNTIYVDGSLQQCPGRMTFVSVRGQF